MKHPWAWVSWLIATLVILSITRNPLYLVLILMSVLVVGLYLRQAGSDNPRPFSLWKLAAWIILLATIFNALTSHYGTTVLFIIPGKLPLISGAVTLEGMVYGVTNGLVLTGMLASFTVLNLALPVRDLISLIPRAFFPVAVVTSIAVTYLPTTMRQFQQIREAQAIRGHQMRTLRDWLPLWMPLLVGGLEHAMQLAEAMTARGFASSTPMKHGLDIYPRMSMVLGLGLLATGWLAQLGSAGIWGLVLIISGSLLIIGGLWYLGRQSPRTAYHRPRWRWQDYLTVIIAVGVIALSVLPVPGLDRQTLFYEPYPSLSLPLFSPWLGIAMLGLIVPGFLVLLRNPEPGRSYEPKKRGNLMSQADYEYHAMMAQTWDLFRGDTSKWEDRSFYYEFIHENGQPVLDVGCGTGRLLLDFMSQGVDIDGVDISPEMLVICREKAEAMGMSPRLYENSMESMQLPRRYQTIIVPSSSFQLVLEPGNARRAIMNLFEHLLAGGNLVMPFMQVWNRSEPLESDWQLTGEKIRPADGATVRRWSKSRYDPTTQLEHNEDRYEVILHGVTIASESHVRSPATREYTQGQALELYRKAGFAEMSVYKGFTHLPAVTEDPIFTIIGKKQG